MALIGLSLILASTVAWVIFRRPTFFETLLAVWRGYPQIDQPPSTREPRPGTPEVPTGPRESDAQLGNLPASPSPPTIPIVVAQDISNTDSDRSTMPPPPPPKVTMSQDPEEQTTPKAQADSPSPAAAIPSLSLSHSPEHTPASAAAVARANPTSSTTTMMPPPSISAPIVTPTSLMPPPPRPPRLNNVSNSGTSSRSSSSLLPPARPSGLANMARQPGTSTLAPPPTHSQPPPSARKGKSGARNKIILEPGHSPLDWARLANSPTSDLRNLPPGTGYIKVTPSMLKYHTGRKGKDAWTALGGRVYNITPYLPFHPGGEPELLRVAGRDGTRLFGEIHPWVNYEGMLASSLIGMLVEEGEDTSGNGAMDEMD